MISQSITVTACLLIIIFAIQGSLAQSFKSSQIKYPRVKEAFTAKEAAMKQLFASRNLAYPPKRVFFRVFKTDQILELWAAKSEGDSLELVKEYRICYSSGDVGPKRRMGDNQVPEGFYAIELFNPFSNFHLSLKVGYPNSSDRILGGGGNLGGDIFIHGNCVSIGCMAMTDDLIKELYVVAVEARSAGQARIPVHIFPTRMNKPGLRHLRQRFPENHALWPFWSNLKEGYDFFETNRKLPTVTIDRVGRYRFTT